MIVKNRHLNRTTKQRIYMRKWFASLNQFIFGRHPINWTKSHDVTTHVRYKIPVNEGPDTKQILRLAIYTVFKGKKSWKLIIYFFIFKMIKNNENLKRNLTALNTVVAKISQWLFMNSLPLYLFKQYLIQQYWLGLGSRHSLF